MYHSDITNVGTFREKDAKLTYDPEVNGGTLNVQGDDWAESVCNDNVIAVIDKPDDSDEDGAGTQRILLISNTKDPSTDASLTTHSFKDFQASNLPQPFIDANVISPRLTQLARLKKESPAHLLYVIISRGSGTGKAQQYFDNVVKPAFAASGIKEFTYYVHTTYSSTSISNFASAVLLPRANEGTPQTILLLSGDGGIVDIVNAGLSTPRTPQYTKPTLGLIPLGTGNAFVNSTGLNKDHTLGLRSFFRGKAHPIPTFTATFSPGSELLVDEGRQTEPLRADGDGNGLLYGAVVCSWALHASLVADSDTTELRKYGSQRFQMAAKELLASADGSAPHAYKGTITLFKKGPKGEEVKQVLEPKEHMYILATLVSNLEEKLCISPHSKPLDGQIRLLHFPPIESGEVMRILGLAFQDGKHVDDEVVGYEDVEGVRVDFEEAEGQWRRVCVDGKIVRVGEGEWVEVRRNQEDVLDVIADLDH